MWSARETLDIPEEFMKTACFVLAAAGLLAAGDWPSFRGPTGLGTSSEAKAPLAWSAGKNVKWKVALPRPAGSSPVVSAGRVYVAGAADAEGRKRTLHCFDRKDGKELWVRTVDFPKDDPTHETNPYGGTTPAAEGKRVVVWHSSAGLHCYDVDGKELWKRDLGEFRHMWGYGSSPVIRGGRVFLNTGPGVKRVFATALDLETGKTLWETEEP
jgi:outer membrane protein assembly factor BamB